MISYYMILNNFYFSFNNKLLYFSLNNNIKQTIYNLKITIKNHITLCTNRFYFLPFENILKFYKLEFKKKKKVGYGNNYFT